MTGNRMELELKAHSTEGIHDFITLLEAMVEDLKGGFESQTSILPTARMEWTITPKQ